MDVVAKPTAYTKLADHRFTGTTWVNSVVGTHTYIDEPDLELQPLPPPLLRSASHRSLLEPASRSSLRRRQKLCDLLEREMKFSHSIQFNAVPDWSSHYISYSNLKKLIYQLEKQLNQNGQTGVQQQQDPESSPLLATNGSVDDPDKTFSRKLDDELEKICSFYQLKELEIYGEVDSLLRDAEEFQAEHDAGEDGEDGLQRQNLWARARQQSIFRSFQNPNKKRKTSTAGSGRDETIPEDEDESEDEDNENTALTKSQLTLDGRATSARGKDYSMIGSQHDLSPTDRRRRPSMPFADYGDDALQALYDEGITLKKRIVNLYVNICELRSFIQLNETGFSKVLKKYDKTLDRHLKRSYIDANVKPAYPFQPDTAEHLSENLRRIEGAYANVVTKGDVETARQELRLHLREHVVWERNTVWREMIGIERKAQAANLGIRNTMLGQDNDPKKARLQGDSEDGALKEVVLPIGRYKLPKPLVSGTFWVLVVVVAIFAVLLSVPIMDKPEQQNCLALVVFVSLLWATEVCLSENENLITFTNLHLGYTSLCHISPRSIPLCCSPCCPRRRSATSTAVQQAGCRLRFRFHVDTSHHVAIGWLHHCRRAQQVQYSQDDGDFRAVQSGYKA